MLQCISRAPVLAEVVLAARHLRLPNDVITAMHCYAQCMEGDSLVLPPYDLAATLDKLDQRCGPDCCSQNAQEAVA